MAITFTYDEATDIIEQTEGTLGTPARFVDFVAFDRNNSAILLAAVTAAAGNILTYPIRPAEQRGLRLDITTAVNGGAAASGDESIDIYGTTFQWTTFSADEAALQTILSVKDASLFRVNDVVRLIDISAPATTETATISAIDLTKEANTITVGATTNAFVTGDIVGINQTETIDTSGGHGAFVTVQAFGQIAYFDCNGYDGTNTVAVTQPIWGTIWDLPWNMFFVDAIFNIGNGVIETYFASTWEMMCIADGKQVEYTEKSTITLGELSDAGDYADEGSAWVVDIGGSVISHEGNLNMYGSWVYGKSVTTYNRFNNVDSVWKVRNSIYFANWRDGGNTNRSWFFINYGRADWIDFYMANTSSMLPGTMTPINLEECWINESAYGTGGYGKNMQVTNGLAGRVVNQTGRGVAWQIDPKYDLDNGAKGLYSDDSAIRRVNTVNIKFLDPNEVAIQNVKVTIKDTLGNIVTMTDPGVTITTTVNYDADHIHLEPGGGASYSDGDIIMIEGEYISIDAAPVGDDLLSITREAYAGYHPNQHNWYNATYKVVPSLTSDASGKIEEQLIVAKQWETNLEVEVDFGPHVFTFSADGYEPEVRVISITKAIDWEIKLVPAHGTWSKGWR